MRSWRVRGTIGLGIVGLITAGFWSTLSAAPKPEKLDARILQAAATIKQTLQDRSARNMTVSALREIARQAQEQLPAEHYGQMMLAELLESSESWKDDAENRERLRTQLDRIHASITFQMIVEAPVPEGFPEITPVNVIQIKSYPDYRMAKVEMKGSQGGAFWSLFNHIKRNDIAMTAPVEMGHASRDPQAQEESMAFLYRTTELGPVGSDPRNEKISVVDIPAATYVSIGCRGKRTEAAIEQAATLLNEWLTENADRYEPTGPIRSMGYNSPFVPSGYNYFEVQIPIAPRS